MAKRMKLRRAGVCADCGCGLNAGTEALWFAPERAVRCLACVETPAAVTVGAPVAAATSAIASPSPEADALADVAGGSAQREYDRRAARARRKHDDAVAADTEWRENLIERRPIVGRISAALTPKPEYDEKQHTTAWKVGAEGERRVAEVLEPVEGIEVLHDRRVPGSKANIDHVVVGSAGVFVVDAKKYTGAIEIRDVGSLFKADHRLYVKGRDRSKLVDAMQWQMEVVREALGPELGEVEVHGTLCFIGAEWGWRMKPKVLRGVTSIWPLALGDHVSRQGPHADRVPAIAEHLRRALPPA